MQTTTIQEKLLKSFNLYSDFCAIDYKNKKYSYTEVNERSSLIAQWLFNQEIEQGSFIGVLATDRYDVITSMLAIWKAGCVFVPIDPDYPEKRIDSMLEVVQLDAVLIDNVGAAKLTNNNILAFELSDSNLATITYLEETKFQGYESDNAIYLYFSSGTSGRPNAIVGRNKGLCHFIEWEINELQLNEGKRVSQFTSPSHDPFLRDVLVPLLSGGTICIPESKAILLQSSKLVEWIEEAKIQVIHCTPSLFKNINVVEGDREYYPHLEYVLLAGEEIKPQKLSGWYDTMGDRVQLVNLYGPTETTLAKLFYRIQPVDVNRARMPIGGPISGTKAILLNNELYACEEGVTGEIYIRTPYQSLGYYNNDELNKTKFIQNPFSDREGDFIYKTGDLGRFLPDGNIEFIGRKDRQVKVRGNRVELDEIEFAILASGLVKDVAVVTKNAPSSEQVIVAYVIPKSDIKANMDNQSILEFYKQGINSYLLDYMIPSFFIELAYFPVTENGKIEYTALPDIERIEFVEPVGQIEKDIARIWEEILSVNQVGRNDSFIQLGGSSINIMYLVAKIYEKYEVDISLELIFENSQLSQIANYVENRLTTI